MQSRASRVARGWIAGSFATGIAAVSHGLADGIAPSALSLLVAFVFAGVLGTLAVGRRPSLPRLAVVVAGSQLAFHLVFSFLTPGGTAPAAGHHAVPELLAPAIAHHGAAPGMWFAHALAGVATLVFLVRAERALWGLLRDALRAATIARIPAVAAPVIVRVPLAAAPRHPVSFSFLSVVSHRGPPVSFAS